VAASSRVLAELSGVGSFLADPELRIPKSAPYPTRAFTGSAPRSLGSGIRGRAGAGRGVARVGFARGGGFCQCLGGARAGRERLWTFLRSGVFLFPADARAWLIVDDTRRRF
jgi:hypothetical protein